jgi:hypothetical protein
MIIDENLEVSSVYSSFINIFRINFINVEDKSPHSDRLFGRWRCPIRGGLHQLAFGSRQPPAIEGT